MAKRKKLERPTREDGRIVAGVAAAVADRFGMARGTIRILFVLFGLVGAGEFVYLALWLLIPPAEH